MSAFSYQLLRTAIRQYPTDRTLRLIRKTPAHVIAGSPADGRECPLHAACRTLDADVVAALLEKGASANARTSDSGETPLHCALSAPDPPRKAAACRSSRLKIVTMLLAAGASSATADDDGNTPVHLAILHGHVACARLLLARDDFALTVPNKRGEIPLFVTAAGGPPPAMDMAAFFTRWHVVNPPLHRAVAAGGAGAVRDALAAGGDVSARGMLGDAALHLAAARGDAAAVRALLLAAADGARAAGYLGGTALHRAAAGCGRGWRARGMDAPAQGRWGEAERALFRSVSEYRRHAAEGGAPACGGRHVEVARTLLDDAGLGADVPDALLRTPLHLAAAAGDEAFVELLLARGADANAPDVDLRTPLWYAAASGNVDLMAVLFRHGASLHLRPDYFRDVGHLAVRCGRRCVSADMLNAADARGRTALIRAVQSGSRAAVGQLLRAGAFAGQRGKGWSPVVQACDRRHWGVTKLLIERGADVREHERDASTTGAMALHLAARGGSSATVREILRAEEARAEEQAVDQQRMAERSPAPSRRPSVQSFRSSMTMQSAWSGGGGATKVPSPTAKAIGFYRWTPLHYAASMGHRGAVDTLLGIMERTEIIARDIDGFTAQELAKGAGYEDIVRLVEERLS